MDFKVWEEVEPPKYTVYNFPPRRDVIPHLDRLSGAAQNRNADMRAGDDDEDDRPVTQSGKSVNDAMTGPDRNRRLYAIIISSPQPRGGPGTA